MHAYHHVYFGRRRRERRCSKEAALARGGEAESGACPRSEEVIMRALSPVSVHRRSRSMQSANANALQILEAMQLLGSSDPAHVGFATCGLTPELQRAAEAATAALRPVASRLKSRKIACRLRIETAQLMAASAHKSSSPVDLSSPPTAHSRLATPCVPR